MSVDGRPRESAKRDARAETGDDDTNDPSLERQRPLELGATHVDFGGDAQVAPASVRVGRAPTQGRRNSQPDPSSAPNRPRRCNSGQQKVSNTTRKKRTTPGKDNWPSICFDIGQP